MKSTNLWNYRIRQWKGGHYEIEREILKNHWYSADLTTYQSLTEAQYRVGIYLANDRKQAVPPIIVWESN